jgi:hypothetical protein
MNHSIFILSGDDLKTIWRLTANWSPKIFCKLIIIRYEVVWVKLHGTSCSNAAVHTATKFQALSHGWSQPLLRPPFPRASSRRYRVSNFPMLLVWTLSTLKKQSYNLPWNCCTMSLYWFVLHKLVWFVSCVKSAMWPYGTLSSNVLDCYTTK